MYTKIKDEEALEMYDDMLNEQGLVIIGSLSLYPSDILKELDEIAYNVGFSEFVDYLHQDGYKVEGF